MGPAETPVEGQEAPQGSPGACRCQSCVHGVRAGQAGLVAVVTMSAWTEPVSFPAPEATQGLCVCCARQLAKPLPCNAVRRLMAEPVVSCRGCQRPFCRLCWEACHAIWRVWQQDLMGGLLGGCIAAPVVCFWKVAPKTKE